MMCKCGSISVIEVLGLTCRIEQTSFPKIPGDCDVNIKVCCCGPSFYFETFFSMCVPINYLENGAAT